MSLNPFWKMKDGTNSIVRYFSSKSKIRSEENGDRLTLFHLTFLLVFHTLFLHTLLSFLSFFFAVFVTEDGDFNPAMRACLYH